MNRELEFLLLFGPEDSEGGGGAEEGEAAESDMDILNSDDDDLNDNIIDASLSSETGDEDESDTDEEEDADSDADSEEEEEDAEGEETPESRASFRDIKTKYPTIFKEFPELEKSFSQARQYQDVFPTIDDAREAQQLIEEYNIVASELAVGSSETFLQEIKKNPDGFSKFVDNFLPSLFKADKEAFHTMTAPLISRVLINAHNAADASLARNPEDKHARSLKLAAKYVSDFIFGTPDIPTFQGRRTTEVDPERTKFENDRNKFMMERGQEALSEVNQGIESAMDNFIAGELKTILPKETPTYIVKNLKKDILNAIDNELGKDANFIRGQRSLVQKASRTTFRDKNTLSRIKSAYLERAKPRIQAHTNRVLKDAGIIKTKAKMRREVPNASARGTRSPNNSRNINPKNVDYSKSSDLDILNDRATLRGK